MARSNCFPAACSGGLAPQEGWVERLSENRYGRHAAWFAPPPENGNATVVELIPWLLFNRHLWEGLPEKHLGMDQDTLSLDIPHEDTGLGGHPGWKVAMRLDMASFSPVQIAAVRADQEAAPVGDEFLPLPAGRAPPALPVNAADGRRRRGLVAIGLLALAGAAAFGAWRLVAGDGDAQQEISNLLLLKVSAAAAHAQLSAQLQSAAGSGLPAEEAYALALSAVNQGAALHWEGAEVRWQGAGEPPGFECGPADAEGWRLCRGSGGE